MYKHKTSTWITQDVLTSTRHRDKMFKHKTSTGITQDVFTSTRHRDKMYKHKTSTGITQDVLTSKRHRDKMYKHKTSNWITQDVLTSTRHRDTSWVIPVDVSCLYIKNFLNLIFHFLGITPINECLKTLNSFPSYLEDNGNQMSNNQKLLKHLIPTSQI